MMLLFRILLIAAGLVSGPQLAFAQFTAFQSAAATTVAYSGPGDVVSGAVVWGSCAFAYNAAYATGSNVGCNYVRASDSHTCDTLITTAGVQGNTANCSTGGDNGQSLSSWLTSTTGKVVTVYDQSGALNCAGATACNPTQGTDANRPVATQNCVSTFSCFTFQSGGGQVLLTAANMTAAAQPVTCYVVAKRTIAGSARALSQGTAGTNPMIGYTSSASTGFISAGTNLTATASDNNYHIILGAFNGNGSNSVIAVDNSETTGAANTNGISAGKLGIGATIAATSILDGSIGEFGCWTSLISSGNRTSLATNVKTTRWGF